MKNYISKLTQLNIISFLRLLDCDKEKIAGATIAEDQPVEGEPNTSLLKVASTLGSQKATLLFSNHGLVNMHKKCNPKDAISTFNNEYACFEQAPASINLTKCFIGFMASVFKVGYLKDEYDHRTMVLKVLEETIERVEELQAEFEERTMIMNTMLQRMTTDKTKSKLMTETYYSLMESEKLKDCYTDLLEELFNQQRYHEAIQEYTEELALDLFKTSLQSMTTTEDIKTGIEQSFKASYQA